MTAIRTIAVDLVPLLPGGDNGGAKIFATHLVANLAKLRPQTRFVLLTQRSAHAELAALDAPNVSRLMVWDDGVILNDSPPLSRYRKAILRRISPYLPDRLHQALRRLLDPLSLSLPCRIGADLMFCPFTLPLFQDDAIPTVSVIYDLQYAIYPEFFTQHEVAERHQNFLRACRSSAAVTTISDFVRDSVLKAQVIADDRVSTVHIQLSQWLPKPDDRRSNDVLARLGLKAGEFLLYPANFWRHKNHELLLTAFAMARAAGLASHIKLALTGTRSARMEELANAASALGLEQHVVFAGFLVSDEYTALMHNCLAVIFPSLYEGFGMPVVEAMAAGCPVACSNLTSLPEVAGDAALLFDPRIPSRVADSILRIASDVALRSELVSRGLKRAEVFSNPRRMAEQYWEVFERAVAADRIRTSLSGLYDDGWASPLVTMNYRPGHSPRAFQVELFAPDWLPTPKIHLDVSNGSGKPVATHDIRAGQAMIVELPVSGRAGRLELRFSPTFRPADSLGRADDCNGDTRELSVMVKRVSIVENDTVTTLSPQ